MRSEILSSQRAKAVAVRHLQEQQQKMTKMQEARDFAQTAFEAQRNRWMQDASVLTSELHRAELELAVDDDKCRRLVGEQAMLRSELSVEEAMRSEILSSQRAEAAAVLQDGLQMVATRLLRGGVTPALLNDAVPGTIAPASNTCITSSSTEAIVPASSTCIAASSTRARGNEVVVSDGMSAKDVSQMEWPDVLPSTMNTVAPPSSLTANHVPQASSIPVGKDTSATRVPTASAKAIPRLQLQSPPRPSPHLPEALPASPQCQLVGLRQDGLVGAAGTLLSRQPAATGCRLTVKDRDSWHPSAEAPFFTVPCVKMAVQPSVTAQVNTTAIITQAHASAGLSFASIISESRSTGPSEAPARHVMYSRPPPLAELPLATVTPKSLTPTEAPVAAPTRFVAAPENTLTALPVPPPPRSTSNATDRPPLSSATIQRRRVSAVPTSLQAAARACGLGTMLALALDSRCANTRSVTASAPPIAQTTPKHRPSGSSVPSLDHAVYSSDASLQGRSPVSWKGFPQLSVEVDANRCSVGTERRRQYVGTEQVERKRRRCVSGNKAAMPNAKRGDPFAPPLPSDPPAIFTV